MNVSMPWGDRATISYNTVINKAVTLIMSAITIELMTIAVIIVGAG